MVKITLILLSILFAVPSFALDVLRGSTTGGGSDYTVVDARVYEDANSNEADYKVCIYNGSTLALVACSNPKTHGATSAWVTVSFTAGPTLDPALNYRIGLISNDNGASVYCYQGSYDSSLRTGGTYASPPAAIAPSTDAGQDMGQVGVYLRNSSAQQLIGFSSGTFVCDGAAGTGNNELKYYTDGYSCCDNE